MKLDDIHKKNIHKVPDGYFDELPLKIQSKIGEPSTARHWVVTYGLRYALPAILLVIVAGYLLTKPSNDSNPEALLAQIETADLILYLEDSDITTEELVEHLELSTFDLNFSEQETDMVDDLEITDDELDALINDFETDDIL